MTRPLPGGGSRSVREPEWDWVDRGILAAWRRITSRLCSLCGRPWAIHDSDDEDDYAVGYLECTATRKLDRVQAEQSQRDRTTTAEGRNPDRHRQWVTWREEEGPPVFSDDDN